MNPLILTPYLTIDNKDYPVDTKILIRQSDFNNISFQDGKITFSFINCRFRRLEIENTETINFEDISFQFISCFISEINVETILTTNLSIFFGSSIIQGRIKNRNLSNVTVNNCLLDRSLFLLNLNSVVVSFTEENVFPIRWQRLFKSSGKKLSDLTTKKQSYYIHDSKNIVFNFNENSIAKRGFYKRPHPYKVEDKLVYYFDDEEKKKFDISLSLQYSADIEHKLTKIINAKLSSLSMKGYATGKLNIENLKVDAWYIDSFTSQIESNFYQIRPYRINSADTKLEIRESNLDNVWFDNVWFNDYSIISFYRNKFGKTYPSGQLHSNNSK